MAQALPGTTGNPLDGHAAPADEVLAALQQWLPHQRWFPAKGTDRLLERVAVVDLADPEGEAEVGLHLLRLPTGGLLQVPAVLRHDDGTDRPGLIARLPGSPARVLVDGCHDPAFLRAWLAAAEHDVPVEPDLTGMRVLTGEQSNTSVLLPAAGPAAILKVFRGLSAGPNPDVDVPLALSHVGWTGVPRPLAWLTGSWPTPEGRAVGHLGVLSELVEGAEDGFELACRYARDHIDFTALAYDLGRTTAQMHRYLRRALPVGPAGPPDATEPSSPSVAEVADPQAAAHAAAVVHTLRSRAAAAVAAAPILSARAERIDQVLAAVERLADLPPLQRVHGDYHLGQVLRSPSRGWAVLDFEGEPQAPAAERTRPDLALRDLAGMLRSFDYAAAVGGATSPEWGPQARASLVEGYHDEADHGPAALPDATTATLLRALELDKALYEVVYESRNRPTWVQIPLDGVDRLLDRVS